MGVAEIGVATGLGRGSLYHHIESKEELLYTIASRYVAELVRAGREITAREQDPIERLRELSKHLMSIVSMHLAEMTVCFREIHSLSSERHEVVSKLHLDYQQIWEDAVAAGVARGVFRPVDRVAIKGLLGMYFYSFLWLKPDGKQSVEEIAGVFSDLVIRSLLADQPAPP